MPTYAQAERQAFCDAALRIGPDAPTLCEGWTVRDLVAHCAMRERRPEAVGVLVPALEKYAEHTRKRYALRPFEDLVDMVRKGPHELNVFQIPALDARANLQEFFIHTEDILRAQLTQADPTKVRALSSDEQSAIYELLPVAARLMARGINVRLAAQVPGMTPLQLTKPAESAGDVVIKGTPSEILLYLAGRMAFVEFEGDPDAINMFVTAPHQI